MGVGKAADEDPPGLRAISSPASSRPEPAAAGRRWKQLWPAVRPRPGRATNPTGPVAPSVAIRAAQLLSQCHRACLLLFSPTSPPEPSAFQLRTQNKFEGLVPIPGLDFRYYSSLSPFPGANSPSSVRRCRSARCSLDLMVPSRLPNAWATRGTVSPEKNLSVTTVLCSSESAEMARRTRCPDSMDSANSAGSPAPDWT